MRFAHGVSDSFIDDYAARMGDMGSIVHAYVVDGEVRGAAELKSLATPGARKPRRHSRWKRPTREHGVGTELMGRVIRGRVTVACNTSI